MREHIPDERIVGASYVGESSYKQVLDKHEKLREPLLDGSESMAYYINKLIPPEPDIYPVTVDAGQRKHPHILLDVVNLEVQYYFSVAVIATINKYLVNTNQYFEDINLLFLRYFFFQSFKLAGWSENGVKKTWEHGIRRYNEYADSLRLGGATKLGTLASENIFNAKDAFAAYYLATMFFSSLEFYLGVFEAF